MSGVEAAGLALALFPIVIETVNRYRGLIRGRDIRHLTDSLRNEEQIYRNCIEYLLHAVWPEELTVLLADLDNEKWRGETLKQKVTESLGLEAERIIQTITDIHSTISRLSRKLPNRRDDASMKERAAHIIKCFVHGPSYSASLERLKTRVNELRTLTKDALKLAPSRCGCTVKTQNLRVVKDSANGLYDILVGGWHCDCDHLHPANIRLDVWSPLPEPNTDISRLYFSLLFADNAQTAANDHWTTAEVTISKAGFQGSSATVQDPTNGSLNGAILPRLSTSQIDTTAVGSQTTSTTTSAVTGPSQSSTSDCVDGLHRFVNANGKSFRLLRRTDPVTAAGSNTLAEFYNKRQSMTNRERVQLALTLAWAVLQMSCTSWLKGKWTKENVLLVTDSTNKKHPYISHRFESSRRSSFSSTLSPTTSNQVADWTKNISLFALGVCLLELCYNKSIEDLAIPEEKQASGDPWPYTAVLTATRLAKSVQDDLGLNYAHAVSACLNAPDIEMDQAGEPKDSSQFEKSMHRNIIDPLKNVADMFAH